MCAQEAVDSMEAPAVVAVVNHLAGHAAVDTDVLAGDESRPGGAEEEHHFCDILRVADSACRVLPGIGAGVGDHACLNPPR